VLYAYLTSERRATTAGRTLHMHRNSVLYHITRIEDLAGISLDDYWTRLKLLLAFHFMELKASNRALTLNGDTAGD
jgi:DNA-binding PucR family transcriptional regulator